ncbi:MAG: insulinase family protein [Planctomycetes bacterium]|nr:insulinase family protein [Planctomycetota bacterium]
MSARSTKRAEAKPMKAGAVIHEHRLKNGLRVLIAERHDDPVVASMVFYGVGSRDEEEAEAGVSHFLEHMMFKGSARFGKGEVDRITTVLGGSNNAFTTPDHTAYWFELASDRWEVALDIEADRMKGLNLDTREFDSEKKVVLEELSMGRDDPWRRLTQAVSEAMFKRHSYRRPVIGYEDVLKGMSVETMRAYYERHYHPGNAVLVICGDVNPRRALKAARERFGSIPAGPRPESERAPITEPAGEQRVTTHWDDSSRRLVMVWPTAVVGSDEDYALDVVTALLTHGRLSRLQARLVHDEKLAVSVSAANDTRVDSGVFWLYAECADGVDPRALERAIDDELTRLGSERLPQSELRRAKRILEASDAHESETVSDIAEELGEFAVDAHWRLAVEGVERNEAVTAVAVKEVTSRFLTPSRRVIGWSLPEGERV